ncbi:tripartite tricarboxylate transporter substrate binding protein [Salipaludibacillus agaradhaerens]|uniref:tripartite tricarboxylate transporter substrate binding protein n=1 Tax=Salipaludibacillus agaradhaerens TaxID=76935 RepID=UPI0021515C49|nr:tripartite tricarboxylate transporter substrate binding protein [Salipaludibacillus agaradhaerens]MCR6106064.1 tripartite tricarboxylate transporter substrate binding protein [Salipaludibacillus agaradhaerens]MCR6118097.1 tripartite tricarboxylate transporter substrate binding protein [Salipaludibacillus agaradhaerens]UJW57227.1 tripartite tricarboxylate transporter substrate binding protein [Bacillus sp. A116_S68]
MTNKLVSALMVTFLLFLAACGNESGEENTADYPEKQIEVVVPFAAGGASDLVSRTIASEMEEELDVPVVITNRTGGSGANGMYSVRDAQADGYTIGYVPVELAMLESLDLADISPNDFEGIGQLMTIPAAITVPADAPYDTIEEFIQFAQENPGNVTIGNSGTGSIWHIAAAAFADEVEIDVQYVPYEGAAPAVTALMGGHIDAVSVSPSEVISGLNSDDLKVLAVMSEEPDANVPDVPTLQELGYDINLSGWGGFVAPKDTPEEVLDTLREAFEAAATSDTFIQLLDERGMNADYKPGDEFMEFSMEQYDFFTDLIPQVEVEDEES